MEERTWMWKASFVALRIVSVYLIIRGIILAGDSARILTETPGPIRWWITIAIVGVVVAGVVLWRLSADLADRVSAASSDEDIDTPAPSNSIDGSTALGIGLVLIGVVISIDGFVAFMVTLGQVLSLPAEAFGFNRTPAYIDLATEAVRAAVGVWLVVGANQLSTRLFRRRGTETDEVR